MSLYTRARDIYKMAYRLRPIEYNAYTRPSFSSLPFSLQLQPHPPFCGPQSHLEKWESLISFL